jgi:single-stranded-DNA-specific exonuclease
MLFGACDPVPQRIEAVYRLNIDEFNGAEGLQLTLQHWRAVSNAADEYHASC